MHGTNMLFKKKYWKKVTEDENLGSGYLLVRYKTPLYTTIDVGGSSAFMIHKVETDVGRDYNELIRQLVKYSKDPGIKEVVWTPMTVMRSIILPTTCPTVGNYNSTYSTQVDINNYSYISIDLPELSSKVDND